MKLNPHDFLKRAAEAELSASAAGSPVLQGKFLQLARAFREIAMVLTEDPASSDAESNSP